MAKRKATGSPGAARRKQRKAKAVIETREKKEFTYRGHTLPELQEMPLEQVIDLLPAGARRSYRRGLLPPERKFLAKVEASDGQTPVRTHYRHLSVLPRFVGKQLAVYDGKEFVTVTVQPDMIGHRLGEFAFSTRTCGHTGVGVGATRSSKHVPLK